MKLECFRMTPTAPALVPGRPDRDWMDAFDQRFPYRCLPLVMANTSGWELRCPVPFEAAWSGEPAIGAIRLAKSAHGLAESHFGGGVLTFHTGWLFRTPPGWAVWASGAPNHVKDGIQPLSGLIETDWLPFPFTMNWRFTRAGKIRFEKDEPFCFITLIEHGRLDLVEPVERALSDDPELEAAYNGWRDRRAGFLERRAAGDAETLRQVWEKRYFEGVTEDGAAADGHVRKRRLKGMTTPG